MKDSFLDRNILKTGRRKNFWRSQSSRLSREFVFPICADFFADVRPVESTFIKERNSTHEKKQLKMKIIWDFTFSGFTTKVPDAWLRSRSKWVCLSSFPGALHFDFLLLLFFFFSSWLESTLIVLQTDPENCDYTLEDGATRNFEAHRTAEEMAKRELKEIEEEEKNNPMKVGNNSRGSLSLQVGMFFFFFCDLFRMQKHFFFLGTWEQNEGFTTGNGSTGGSGRTSRHEFQTREAWSRTTAQNDHCVQRTAQKVARRRGRSFRGVSVNRLLFLWDHRNVWTFRENRHTSFPLVLFFIFHRSIFGRKGDEGTIKRLADDETEQISYPKKKLKSLHTPTDILTQVRTGDEFLLLSRFAHTLLALGWICPAFLPKQHLFYSYVVHSLCCTKWEYRPEGTN